MDHPGGKQGDQGSVPSNFLAPPPLTAADQPAGSAPQPFPSALEATLAAVTRPSVRLGLGHAPVGGSELVGPALGTAPGPSAAPPLVTEAPAAGPTASGPPAAAPPPPTLYPPTAPVAVNAQVVRAADPGPVANPQVVPAVGPAPVVDPTAPAPALPALPMAVSIPAPAVGVATNRIPTGMTPQQMAAVQVGVSATASASRGRRRNGPRVAKTLILMVLAAGLAAGGRYGLDWYERTEAEEQAADAAGADAELAVGLVDPPDLQYVVVEITAFDEVRTMQATSQVNLRDDYKIIDHSRSPVPAGGPSALTIDVRGDRVVARADGAGAWIALDEAEIGSLEPLLDNFGLPWVLTLSDVVPPESLPFVTIVERSDEQLEIGPLVESNAGGVTAPGTTESTTAARRFVVRRDEEAFRAAELARYRPWTISGEEFDELEIWVDDANIVRKLRADSDVDTITFTWTHASRTASSFPAAPPVVVNEFIVDGT